MWLESRRHEERGSPAGINTQQTLPDIPFIFHKPRVNHLQIINESYYFLILGFRIQRTLNGLCRVMGVLSTQRPKAVQPLKYLVNLLQ